MKIKLILIAFLATLGISNAQTQNDSRQLRDFNVVKVSNAIKAELVKGDVNKVEITASGIDVGKVETSVVGDALEVRLARGNYRNHSVRVVVTYVDIQGVEATSSAQVVAKSKIEALEAYLATSNNAYLEANVEADKLNLEAATNSRIFIKGNVKQLEVNAYTNAQVDGMNLVAQKVNVLGNTTASISFTATSSINGSLATAAKIVYDGNPSEVNVKTGTGGSIKKK
ncbi:head GIN domain-containing protein [Aquiflexum gelatinilyticum]|uniref:DUF2807 domain-containing protein n=1 Tax=Aquiflexum gelatinilyticum TaxID=2961943 RepID=A0A9X2T274_9BACT|nr:head GIN domain-containing protein [Aquiflexum gelatinilyticum]MCR9015155.1 DUF2807 domain-containing protein [Aquiflexum gelatinilyticum]MCS4433909.1 DUF2807 domain-containing protein [Aquiflexum gelatinilyticum]